MNSTDLSAISGRLQEAMAEMETIDAHEHLGPERMRLALEPDVFNLFGQYVGRDVVRAGLPEAEARLVWGRELPLEERWARFAQYLPLLRQTSFFRAGLRTIQLLYGQEDLTGDNYEEISERVRANNTPGIYQRLLRDTCKIRLALTQRGSTEYDLSLFRIVQFAADHASVRSWEEVEARAAEQRLRVKSLDDFLQVAETAWTRWKGQGVVGMKVNDLTLPAPDRPAAETAWAALQAGRETDWAPLHAYLHHYLYQLCGRLGLTVAIHTGFFWGDYRRYDVKLTIPLVQRYPQVRFDLYHAGMPNIRESAFMAKNFPNVWLNLTWAHMISQEMVQSGLREWLDLVPINKIIGFGGDHGHGTAEKVVGHLALARENIATVLAERVGEGRMSEEDAVFVAGRWLWDNPIEAYQLSL